VIEAIKKGVLRYRTPLEKLTSGLPKGSPSRPERCLNANRQSDSFTSLEIAPRNSNHIPGGTGIARGRSLIKGKGLSLCSITPF
jgi:hypothetical protein